MHSLTINHWRGPSHRFFEGKGDSKIGKEEAERRKREEGLRLSKRLVAREGEGGWSEKTVRPKASLFAARQFKASSLEMVAIIEEEIL